MKMWDLQPTRNLSWFKKIMERRFNTVDRSRAAAHTSANLTVQVHDYV